MRDVAVGRLISAVADESEIMITIERKRNDYED
jgi:hypothetical protein